MWLAVPVLRAPALWQRRPVARHPAAVPAPLAPAWLRACLSARRPSLHARRVLVFCARCATSPWRTEFSGQQTPITLIKIYLQFNAGFVGEVLAYGRTQRNTADLRTPPFVTTSTPKDDLWL